jgi:hypothetical protein
VNHCTFTAHFASGLRLGLFLVRANPAAPDLTEFASPRSPHCIDPAYVSTCRVRVGFAFCGCVLACGSSDTTKVLFPRQCMPEVEFRVMLGGWYLDILIVYLIRYIVRIVKLHRSDGWPLKNAVVSSSRCPPASSGGPVAEIGYTYEHAGSYYAGLHREPFILRSSAEDYAARFITGNHIVIRVDPKRPEISILRQDDQTRVRLPLANVAVGQQSP